MIWHMTVDEIRQKYRHAKNPREQVRILAQLNCCGIQDIITLLIESGEPIRTHRGNGTAVRLLDTEIYRDYAELNRRRRVKYH